MADQIGKIIGNCIFCNKPIQDREVFGRTKIDLGFEYWHPICKKKPTGVNIGKCVYCNRFVYSDEQFYKDRNEWICHSECYLLMVNRDRRGGN